MQDLLRPHDYRPVPGVPGQVTLVKVTPYIRVSVQGHPPMFLRDGQVWTEGGEAPEFDRDEELPDWLEAEVMKMSPAARREIGFERDGDEEPIIEKPRRRRARNSGKSAEAVEE